MWIDRRTLGFALIASLLLNGFLLGLIGAQAWTRRHPPRQGRAMIPAANVQALPADQRQAYRQALARHHDSIRTLRHARADLQRTTEADIAAAVFDRAKVTADFVELRRATLALQESYSDALIEALQDLPQSARAILVRRQERAANSR